MTVALAPNESHYETPDPPTTAHVLVLSAMSASAATRYVNVTGSSPMPWCPQGQPLN
jgi:hypothetical protein